MKLRISQNLYDELKRARAWSGVSIADICRRAYRRYQRLTNSVVLDEFRDNTTTDGTVIDAPDGCTGAVLWFYLSAYEIPRYFRKQFDTPLVEGIDYIIQPNE